MTPETAETGTAKKTKKAPNRKNSVRMWGKPVMDAGYSYLPNTLLLKQDELELDSVDVNILLHLITSWWKKERAPYLSKRTIATRMGVNPSTVQRHVRRMEAKGLLKRVERRGANKGRQTNCYDLRLLADKLHPLAVAVKKERAAKRGDES
jgi:hypothetical protein